MKKTLLILGLSGFLFACNDSAETENTENENKDQTEQSEENDMSEDMKQTESEEEEESSSKSVSLEDRAYSVEEFAKMYEENKVGLKGQVITIEGYYMNHNKQKASGSDEYEYNVTLYKDDSFDRDAAQAFFKMKSNNKDQFDGITQKDKIKVSGTVAGEEFFDAPLLEDGVVVK